MASTYTTGFGIEKIGSGEQAGAWGTTTNHNADILDRIASYKAVALSGTTHTLTVREVSPGSGTENLQDGMYRVIKFTGALGANNTVTIAPNTSPVWFIIENATTDSGSSGPYSVILTQGSGANVTVQNGKNAIIYCDGAGAGAVVYDALADLQVGTLEVTGAAAIDGALTAAAISATTLTTSGIASIDDTTDTTSGTTGSIHTDGGLGVAKNLFVATNATVSGTTLMTGVTTHGGNVVSDTDSTDDLGTTGVRWANLFVDGITATDQITATGFTGTLDGILGSGTPAAATVTTLTASGVTTVQAGTALLPSIVPTGDTNTGVWFPAADTVAASTAGVERMRIDSSGNVGIGVSTIDTALGTKLHVAGTIRTDTGSASANPGIVFDHDNFADADANSIALDRTSEAMLFTVNASERMRIESGGKVGIGTSAPASNLDVVSAIRASNPTGSAAVFIEDGASSFTENRLIGLFNDNGLRLQTRTGAGVFVSNDYLVETNATGASSHRWAIANSEKMRIDSNGNVGIGVSTIDTALGTKLHVAGTIRTDTGSASANPGIVFDHDNFADADANSIALDRTSEAMLFTVNASERMRINSSGKVGIGTSSPAEELHVYSNNAPIVLIEAAAGNDSRLRLLTPNDRIGFIEFGDSDDADTGEIRYEHTTNNMVFSTNGTSEAMRIDSSGNVGIGTSSPANPLHVVGEGTFTRGLELGINGVDATNYITQFRSTVETIMGPLTTRQLFGTVSNHDIAIQTNNTEVMRIESGGVVRPSADNTQSIGAASYRWSVVYAGTGTINTSDEREKQQISALDDAERRVAVAIKGLVKKYKYNDAVAIKGPDARIHVGVIAQEVVAAFAAEGLDATRYALLCHDTWEAEPEEMDDEGHVTSPGREAGERYGVRYDELLAFMIAAL
jgi:hypothetical protein